MDRLFTGPTPTIDELLIVLHRQHQSYLYLLAHVRRMAGLAQQGVIADEAHLSEQRLVLLTLSPARHRPSHLKTSILTLCDEMCNAMRELAEHADRASVGDRLTDKHLNARALASWVRQMMTDYGLVRVPGRSTAKERAAETPALSRVALRAEKARARDRLVDQIITTLRRRESRLDTLADTLHANPRVIYATLVWMRQRGVVELVGGRQHSRYRLKNVVSIDTAKAG